MDKKWYQSKAKLSAVAIIFVTCVNQLALQLGFPQVHIPSWIKDILLGSGVYGLRDAIKEKDDKPAGGGTV